MSEVFKTIPPPPERQTQVVEREEEKKITFPAWRWEGEEGKKFRESHDVVRVEEFYEAEEKERLGWGGHYTEKTVYEKYVRVFYKAKVRDSVLLNSSEFEAWARSLSPEQVEAMRGLWVELRLHWVIGAFGDGTDPEELARRYRQIKSALEEEARA